jgi:hypothetical protein
MRVVTDRYLHLPVVLPVLVLRGSARNLREPHSSHNRECDDDHEGQRAGTSMTRVSSDLSAHGESFRRGKVALVLGECPIPLELALPLTEFGRSERENLASEAMEHPAERVEARRLGSGLAAIPAARRQGQIEPK